MIWVLIAGLAGAAVLAMVSGLRGTLSDGVADAARPGTPQTADMAVYRDQIAEIDRDVARGVLSVEDATLARAEVSRRLLDADRRAAAHDGTDPRMVASLSPLTYAALVAVPVAALLLYAQLGRPTLPDRPIAQRLQEAEDRRLNRMTQAEAVAEVAARGETPAPVTPDPEYAALLDRLRQAVSANPGDLRGQQLLAENEAKVGNLDAAITAQGRVITLKGEDATGADHAFRAELMLAAARGYVSPEAEADLTEALRRDPSHRSARYMSGLLMIQTGRLDLGFRLWAALLEELPPDAPMATEIREQIGDLAWFAGEPDYVPPGSTGSAAPGPDAAAMAAAADMTPEERQEMIQGMVAQLNDRLTTSGGTTEEWGRLVNAYVQLNQSDEAARALSQARTALAGDTAGLAALESMAEGLGLPQP